MSDKNDYIPHYHRDLFSKIANICYKWYFDHCSTIEYEIHNVLYSLAVTCEEYIRNGTTPDETILRSIIKNYLDETGCIMTTDPALYKQIMSVITYAFPNIKSEDKTDDENTSSSIDIPDETCTPLYQNPSKKRTSSDDEEEETFQIPCGKRQRPIQLSDDEDEDVDNDDDDDDDDDDDVNDDNKHNTSSTFSVTTTTTTTTTTIATSSSVSTNASSNYKTIWVNDGEVFNWTDDALTDVVAALFEHSHRIRVLGKDQEKGKKITILPNKNIIITFDALNDWLMLPITHPSEYISILTKYQSKK